MSFEDSDDEAEGILSFRKLTEDDDDIVSFDLRYVRYSPRLQAVLASSLDRFVHMRIDTHFLRQSMLPAMIQHNNNREEGNREEGR